MGSACRALGSGSWIFWKMLYYLKEADMIKHVVMNQEAYSLTAAKQQRNKNTMKPEKHGKENTI